MQFGYLARTTAAIAARRRVGNKPKPFRTYALRGLLFCSCGTRLRGEAHLQRGTERRYYRCPTLGCKAPRCPAEAIEAEVLDLAERNSIQVGLAALPDSDRIRSFDAYRARALELPEAIAVASPARREELCRIVIERIVIRDRRLDSITWTPPVRPSLKDSGSAPKGIRTPDLHLERVAS